MKHIDLRSDTVTQPPLEMKKAMFEAELGDDVYEDDPTVILLEKRVAELLGKEASLFVPTGGMGNQLAVFTHVKSGQEVILADESHIVIDEAAAIAVCSRVQLRCLEAVDGYMDIKEIVSKLHVGNIDHWIAPTGLISIQNPSRNGLVLSLEYMKSVKELAEKNKVPVHLDAARIFNAAAYLNCEAKEIAKYADSIMMCLSKGLCCPVGSMLVGSKDFIAQARRNRKMFGGGMRQVGILAGAGLWALDNMVPRIGDDLKNAKYFAKKLKELGDVVELMKEPEINMVFIYFKTDKFNKEEFEKFMLEREIKVDPPGNGVDLWRFVTHYWVGEKEVEKSVEAIKEYLKVIGAI